MKRFKTERMGNARTQSSQEESLKRVLSQALTNVERYIQTTTFADMVAEATTHAIGDGMWSIELHTHRNDPWGEVIAEFVGSNGTRSFVNDEGFLENEPADDLWAEVDEWYKTTGKKIYRTTVLYYTPDGKWLPFFRILHDIEDGNLHGLTLKF